MRKNFLLLMAACSVLMNAESFTVGKLNYETTSETTVAIVYSDDGYTDLKNSDFAATVTNDGKSYTVTAIDEYAFEEAVFAESIVFPSTIASIGDCAFSWAEADGLEFTFSENLAQLGGDVFDCSSVAAINIAEGNTVFASQDGVLYSADKKILLVFPSGKNVTSFTIPEFVERVFEGAFMSGQWYLTEVTIPATVKVVDGYAFYNNSTLETLTIEGAQTQLGESAFIGCEGLTELNLPEGLKTIPKNCFFDLCSLPSLTLPEGLESIGMNGFGFGGFSEVKFPSTLKSIGMQAFANCENLTTVALPDGVTEVGDNCFSSCVKLTSVDLNNVKTLGEFAFSSCSALTQVLSPKLETIGASVFYLCTSLQSYEVPETVKEMGGTVFFGATALQRLVIGKNVETIGAGITVKTNSLPAIEVHPDNQYFVAVDGVLYTKDMTTLMAYPCGRENTALNVPAGVKTIGIQALRGANVVSFNSGNDLTTIGANAFSQCEKLATVVLGEDVTSIAANAFNQCKAITDITCRNSEPAENVTFAAEVYANATLRLPSAAAIDAYKATTNWGQFTNFALISDGISDVSSLGKMVVNEVYYDIDGRVLAAPVAGKAVIAVRKYSDGSTTVAKEIAR
ncbi:MAG: leucine-rich repeat protein [Muribaculaceae bacterium]